MGEELRSPSQSRRRLAIVGAAALLAVTACAGDSTRGSTSKPPPTANMTPQTSIGPGEGQLNLIARQGYVNSYWVTKFTAMTRCKVNAKYADTPDEVFTLMEDGGGGQYDMVSALGNASIRLIYTGDVRPMNPDLVPDWVNFQTYFKAPPYNTISGIHYGISLLWGPNVLLYNTKKFPTAPTTWAVIYDKGLSGLVTAYDDPMTIADAALYLAQAQPKLGIKDPYELTQAQFEAAIALLKDQKPLIKKYWTDASDEIALFQKGDVVVGAAWPDQTIQLKLAKAPVAETIPSEGATGWGATWMLATKAPHPNCAYLWTKYVSTPFVQAQQALSLGETPVNTKACAQMEALSPGSCAQYHANAPAAYFDTIKFWKTPIADCGDGSQNCVPYEKWQNAWTAIVG